MVLVAQIIENKAGYTANTSRGRVGRGVFALSQLDHHGPTNQPTDGWTDGRTDKVECTVKKLAIKN